ncbi:MAG TPA: DUF4397 domain-containing protein [Bacilli bacterium]|nr:DUF4397 domain-containing protein [Bacilli bacterium]
MKDRRQNQAYEGLVREMENLLYLVQQGQQNQQEFMTEAFRLIQAQSQDVEEMRQRVHSAQEVIQKLEDVMEKLGVHGVVSIGPDGQWEVGVKGAIPGMTPAGEAAEQVPQQQMPPTATQVEPVAGGLQPNVSPSVQANVSPDVKPNVSLPPTYTEADGAVAPPVTPQQGEQPYEGYMDAGAGDKTGRDPDPVAKANVRFLHASPDAPNVDIFVDGKKVATDVGYQGISPYLPFTATRHKVQVFPAGKQVGAVIDTTVQLKPNRHYTIAAAGTLENIRPVVVEDVRHGGKPGFARLKVVHLVPNAPAVDVTLPSGKILLGHLTYKEVSPYLQVTPGRRTLDIRLARKNDIVLKLPNARFDPNVTYTLYLLGLTGQEPSQLVPLLLPEVPVVPGE